MSASGRYSMIIVIQTSLVIPIITVILRNVTIGEGAVVAAGSVVTHNIPPFELWGGVPARSLGKRPQNMRYEFKGTYCHFL